MKLYFFIAAIFTLSLSFAQQHLFLYIQTENKQPFYVKTNDKLYSSSATGYVVISKLSPDTHILTIGFNKDAFPEQNFDVLVDKDAGYLLKNYGATGWGLLNLQSNVVVMNGAQALPEGVEEDGFTKTLSQVVNSPDLKSENNTAVKKEKKPDVPLNKPEVKIEKGNIRLLLNEADKLGRQMIYIDGLDTIRIFISGTIDNTEISTANKKVVEPVKILEPQPEEINKSSASNKLDVSRPEVKGGNEIQMINSDCKLLATQDEFLKLRKKMAAALNDEDMVSVAKKQFKSRCFATEQIRNLSVLFLSDKGKYAFLDAAYPFVHDSSSFSSLESILTDAYYKNRFQAMIRR